MSKSGSRKDKADSVKEIKSSMSTAQATRETVESVVIAVVLAFLFRGFVAEAFVIPTGSMAPTLQGRHIDVTCPKCSYSYQTGASEENEENLQGDRGGIVEETFCPLCRFPLRLDREANPNHRSFNGDRILVSKFAYELGSPERWDVIVFKYPGNAKQNYIKRLVGLPNELIRVRHGDIYAAPWLFDMSRQIMLRVAVEGATNELLSSFSAAGFSLSDQARIDKIPSPQHPLAFSGQGASSMWTIDDPARKRSFVIRVPYGDGPASVFGEPRIVRKPPEKQDALLQLVYDTAYPCRQLDELGWPQRWRDESEQPRWESSGGIYSVATPAEDWAWLRYRHCYPSEREWRTIMQTNSLPDQLDRPDGELITDYYTYNDRHTTAPASVRTNGHAGMHWVGDLAIECEFNVIGESGEVAVDLVEGGVHYRCTFDLQTGTAKLSKSDGRPFIGENGEEVDEPAAKTSVRGAGSYRVRMVNADDQLRVWVDGDLVEFDGPTTYVSSPDPRPFWLPDDPGDLAPAGVGARQVMLDVTRLKVFRDVYYLAIVNGHEMLDYNGFGNKSEIRRLMHSPEDWDQTKLFSARRTAEFVIGPNRFFPLGDNSPQSLDGRLWSYEPSFDEDMLIGKAILIYWPHSWRRPIPYLPNFKRMGLIH